MLCYNDADAANNNNSSDNNNNVLYSVVMYVAVSWKMNLHRKVRKKFG